MALDGAEIGEGRSLNGGGKVRLKTLDDLDRRTRAAQAVFELRDRLVDDLGGKDRLSIMQTELINNAACLGAMLKDSAASYLQGEPIDLTEYMALTNAQRRLLADLGLEKRIKDVTSFTESLRGAG